MPAIHHRNGEYTAYGLRNGYTQNHVSWTKDNRTYYDTSFKFSTVNRKYYIAVNERHGEFVARSEYIGNYADGRKRFYEIRSAVQHAVWNDYL